MCKSSGFSTSSSIFVIVCLLDYRHPSGCEVVILHYGFDLYFSTANDVHYHSCIFIEISIRSFVH